MTDEIIKLYENAGIKPIKQGYCDWDSDCPYPDIINNGCGDECPYWKYEDEANYPPFTAEKQIELIKWLIKYDELHADFNDNEYGFSTLNYSGKYKKDFEESLASVINNELWQDLTEDEKISIKNILEM